MKIDIDNLSDVARISLTAKEKFVLHSRLKVVLNFVKKINKVDIKGVQPTSHVFPIYNVWNDNNPTKPYSTRRALMNSTKKSQNQIVIPRVVN